MRICKGVDSVWRKPSVVPKEQSKGSLWESGGREGWVEGLSDWSCGSHPQDAASPHWPGVEGAEGMNIQFHSFSLLLLMPPLCAVWREARAGVLSCAVPLVSLSGPGSVTERVEAGQGCTHRRHQAQRLVRTELYFSWWFMTLYFFFK